MSRSSFQGHQPLDDSLIEEMSFEGDVVAGVDEVGRGCLAGPVVSGAVILPRNTKIPGVRDSKLLTLKQRRILAVQIKLSALAVGLGWASHREIDQHGLTRATMLSAKRALENLNHSFAAVLLDGKHNYLHGLYRSKAVIGADNLCLSVACASIVAKVARDNYMLYQHHLYPEFGFNRNVGYATARHLAALSARLSPIHRRRFAPVANRHLLSAPNVQDAFFEALFEVN